MMAFYYLLFAAILLGVLYQEYANRTSAGTGSKAVAHSSAFLSFRNNYLMVYCLMMAGDWLQGPYVYALYSHYGYGVGDIGHLFIAGFGSSMIFGTIVGSMADKHGRKLAGLCYVVTYIASCITKHWSNYSVLMLGRFFGGIATSLLFSAFESWYVGEHTKRGFDEEWMSGTFAKAVFFGNGVVAIVSGMLANTLVDNFQMGPVAPFDAAATFLTIGGAIIFATWSENYGDSGEVLSVQLKTAMEAIKTDRKVALLGAIQSLFEAAMYTFVFLWTPALSPHGESIPHGFIFATFMLASMGGSSLADRLMGSSGMPPVEVYMQTVFVIAGLTLAVPVLLKPFNTPPDPSAHTTLTGGAPMSFIGQLQMVSFCVFEACVGVFWPSLMRMRAKYVPEGVRATIMNLFRMPLNLFVCVVLYNVAAFPLEVMFAMCALFLLATAACQRQLAVLAGVRDSDAIKADV